MVTNVFVVQDVMATNVKVSTYLHVSTFIYNKAALNTEKSLIKKYLYRWCCVLSNIQIMFEGITST